MQTKIFSHNYGEYAVSQEILTPLLSKINNLKFEIKSGCATKLREALLEDLRALGWSGETRIQSNKGITITSMNSDVGLCLQTGNMSRFYADLLKLQTLFQKDRAKCAIYILPTKKSASTMGNNLANFERLTDELTIFKHVISIPILVIGIDINKED
ncbi:BglII/BstYI family type II restriction endonuclease [Priestia filamentosa]|uniref:BglII/BstYI family type II restriction endonuclease n=1 Tax=Priestia filamentosa TaxID=1402861 RepID=UPI000E74092E|nr:BglII/BstYI family type II restriction endonuclease [Priestia filamentosa]RJS63032.1 restriction endonuclease [Priestia filamentosa]